MDGSRSVEDDSGSIASAREIMKDYPKGTKIFMAFFMPAVCGLMGLMITADLRKVNTWIMPAVITINIIIGCILSFFIIIKPMIEEYNETYYKKAKSTDLTSWDKIKRKERPSIKYILSTIWGLALVGCLFYAIIKIVLSPTIYTENGFYKAALKETSVIIALSVFGGSIFLIIVTQALKNIRNWKLTSVVTTVLIIVIIASFIYAGVRVSQSGWIKTANGGYNAALKEPLVVVCLIIPGAGTIIVGGLLYNRHENE